MARDAGLATAGRFARDFDNVFAVLADHPGAFPPRRALGIRIRMGVVPPYLVFHEHDAALAIVGVLRIVHGKRLISRRLFRGLD